MPTVTRNVPILGQIGTNVTYYSDAVAQFRGIPYATVHQRFRQAKLLGSWPGGQLDASKFGPVSPSPATAASFNLLGITLEEDEPLVMDEFACLNLNITTPLEQQDELLPVAVFIHGGANCFSSGSAPGLNGAAFVHQSMGLGMPVIFVTVNFRMGAVGFMASQDIKEDNANAGDPGVGNYGIGDQILALRWIKQHISAFGGDPSRVTVMGESAGASDVHIQMFSSLAQSQNLYSQVVLSSGNAVMTTRTLAHQHGVYEKFLEHFSIPPNLSPQEKVDRLRSIGVSDLLNAYHCTGSPLPNWQATVDGHLLERLPATSGLAQQKYDSRVRRIMVGDCEEEGIIWTNRIRQAGWTTERITSLLSQHFSESTAEDMAREYELSADLNNAQGEAMEKLARFCGDAEFAQPLYEVVRNWQNGDAFYYRMRFKSSFGGPFSGSAHHAVDLLFMFQTYNHVLPASQAAAAEEMGCHLISFIRGLDPWKPYSEENNAMCYGPDTVNMIAKGEDGVGRYGLWDRFGREQDAWTRVSRHVRKEVIYV